MRDHLTTLAGALLVLAFFTAMFYTPPAQPPSNPLSINKAGEGYAALDDWLKASNIATHSQRRRIGQRITLAPVDGNVMLTTLPHSTPMLFKERTDLRKWVRNGNTLIVMAALNDTPIWSLTPNAQDMFDEMTKLTHLSFDQPGSDEDQGGEENGDPTAEGDQRSANIGETLESALASIKAKDLHMQALPGHPINNQVVTLFGESTYPSSTWVASASESSAVALELAKDSGTGEAAMWWIPLGKGAIIVSASATPLANCCLDKADNARWWANITGNYLGPSGVVIFDDYHHGLSDLYDPDAFYSDPRLAITIAFVVAFWLIYLVGSSTRLVIPPPALTYPRQGDLVSAMGNFMARKLTHGDAGKLLVETWVRDNVGASALMDDGTPDWDNLASLPTIDQESLASLGNTYHQLARGEKLDLRNLHENLRKLRSSIT